MKNFLKSVFIKRRTHRNKEINPEEIFMDSTNLPEFDTHQFEGRLDRPISRVSLAVLAGFFICVVGAYIARAWVLQVKNGEMYTARSENNRLRHTPLFAPRGVIYDRNGVELAWNAPSDDPDVPLRAYREESGLAHVVGYVQYPTKDSAGFYYREDFEGADGAEKYFNTKLQGENGLKLIEVNAQGKVQSGNVMKPPKQGENITLSIDSRVQSEFYRAIEHIAQSVGFAGGAGIMMDVTNGEVIAMTSYPEYDSEVMSSRKDAAKVKEYLTNKNKPFLDRAVNGLYTPGSIVKPYVALGALSENIIDPMKKILSTGSISIQNDYDPKLQTIFRDWKALGWMDMRHAIAMSSDVYFYTVGGGYKDQKGLGIANINKYMSMFGFGKRVENSFFSGAEGTVPSPAWKAEHFDGETWRLGNTYHTAIGQYGFQVSPVQIVRGMSAIATNGILRDPSIVKGEPGPIIQTIAIPKSDFDIIHEGMRLGVTEGTGVALNVPFVKVASKSGTAELGVDKANVNSWITGFFPYENPRYAFAIVMEKGSVHNLIGAAAAMKEVLNWMSTNTPEYFK
jgi:penicillin-binding protein 2